MYSRKYGTCIDLEYADDMALVNKSMNALNDVFRAFNALCMGMGLAISARKTKILTVCPVHFVIEEGAVNGKHALVVERLWSWPICCLGVRPGFPLPPFQIVCRAFVMGCL